MAAVAFAVPPLGDAVRGGPARFNESGTYWTTWHAEDRLVATLRIPASQDELQNLLAEERNAQVQYEYWVQKYNSDSYFAGQSDLQQQELWYQQMKDAEQALGAAAAGTYPVDARCTGVGTTRLGRYARFECVAVFRRFAGGSSSSRQVPALSGTRVPVEARRFSLLARRALSRARPAP
jgi:hypothetical protein